MNTSTKVEQTQSINHSLHQQLFNAETIDFLNNYFSNEDYFLLSSGDFIRLEKINSAFYALCELMLNSNSHCLSISFEALADLFSSCIEPLPELLTHIKTVTINAEEQTDRIKLLAKNIQGERK